MDQQHSSNPHAQLDPLRWVERHSNVLMGYAVLRVRNRDIAEDLVQETLAAAWQSREGFRGGSDERTWLVGILKRKIFDFYRRRWREQPVSALSLDQEHDELMGNLFDEKGMWKDDKPQTWADPRHALDVKDIMEHLERCLAKLPARLAEVFMLRELEQIDGAEICQACEISATNLWQMIHRARVRLRSCLEKNGFGAKGERRS